MGRLGRQIVSEILYDIDRISPGPTSEEGPSLFWRDVMKVTAWKDDLLVVDLICLTFETAQSVLTVHEDLPGWQDLIRNLPEYLPGFPTVEEWHQGVMIRPFDPCETVLYRRHHE